MLDAPASNRLTTLILVATNTPARSCSSTRRRVRYILAMTNVT